MKPERWEQVKQALAGALESPPEDRHAYLDRSCPDPDLRREVESLIAAHEQGGSDFMEPPTKAGPLQPGTKLGPYEIVSRIGAGGMGEVYRAHDTKLRRDVAIKVLPPAFVNAPDRLARFQREAILLASLNHPNIASIYGLEDSDSTHALVMELVEGPTLADRIAQGPVPIDEALPIAKQIAEGLEYAHEHGIVHRDLKPANIKAATDGTAKILDFGLAKAMETGLSPDNMGNSPTLSQMATQQGVLLGTAAYMSPEQAKAKPVDRRADIWAFGCVLFEMLTGKLAFPGESVTETLAAVLKNEPDWSQLPHATPALIRAFLGRCLQKDPRQRLQAIGEARIAIDNVLSGTPEAVPSPTPAVPVRHRALPWALGVLAVAIVGAAVWILKPSPPPATRPVTRFTITLPPGQQLAGNLNRSALAVSADGNELAYVATTQGGQPEIYLRAMNGVEARPIPGTEGATEPFFSPDGQWLGFFVDGKLEKISLRGGVAQTLTETVNPLGATWGSQHTIDFAPYSSIIQQISDAGGAPQQVSRFESGETMHMWPEFLPGSKAVLFAAYSPSRMAIAVQATGKDERRDLIQGQAMSMPSYAPSGHLVFEQAGNLMAVPLDLGSLQVKGAAVPVVQGVLQYSISTTGTLVYVAGKPQSAEETLVWVSRNGKEQALGSPPRYYNQPRLSPDGRRVAVDVIDSRGMQVWLYDIARDALTRFTFEGVNRHAVWTPDGKRIAFMSDREGPTQIFWKLANGSGGSQRLSNFAATTPVDILPIPYSWSPDGKLLAFVKLDPAKVAEFWLLHVGEPPGGAGKGDNAQFLFPSPAADGAPQFSPDGRWLAYASDESGRREIYVQAYPGPGGKWQISTDGGTEPQWNPNGRELFYRNGDKMMAVEITTRPAFAAGKPRQLFEGSYVHTAATYVRANYDVSPDGQRFLMLKAVAREQAPQTQINVVLNWTEELKRRVPTGK